VPSFWILLAVLFYGFAMQQTGLAKRVAFHIHKFFPRHHRHPARVPLYWIGADAGHSVEHRPTAIMVPIAWAMVKSLGLEDRSHGSALIMLVTSRWRSCLAPVRYGSLFGPVVTRCSWPESAAHVGELRAGAGGAR
jgi:di/tricarboxylate transporter